MINPFNIETFPWYWYSYWLPVAAAGIATAHTAIVWGTSKMNLYGSFMRIISVMAVIASIPLAAMRLDFSISGNIYVMLGMSLGSPIAVIALIMLHSMVLGNRRTYSTAGSPQPVKEEKEDNVFSARETIFSTCKRSATRSR